MISPLTNNPTTTTPITSIKSPLSFYWLSTTNALIRIQKNIQLQYKCKMTYQPGTLYPLLSDQPSLQQQISLQISRQFQQLQSNCPMQPIQITSQQELTLIVNKLTQKYPDIYIVNVNEKDKQIRECLAAYQLTNLLHEYENYYSLQNTLYVFSEHKQEVVQLVEDSSDTENVATMKEENLMETYAEKIDHKIQHLEITAKMAEFDGVELWHCTYKSIPHTYMKCTKDTSWLTGLSKPLLHNCHPKTIQNLPLLPPLSPLHPHPSHIPTLISFLDTLAKKYPTHSPTVNSIFQHQHRLMIFTKQTWLADRGWLCYRVAYGEISYQGYLNWLRRSGGDVVAGYAGKLGMQQDG